MNKKTERELEVTINGETKLVWQDINGLWYTEGHSDGFWRIGQLYTILNGDTDEE
jgi:hypothetical protein